MTIRRLTGVLAAIAALTSISIAGVALAATTSQKAAVKQAKANVKRYSKPVKKLNIAPTRTAVPKGKTVIMVSAATTGNQAAGVKAAGAQLGWNVSVTTPPFTPEGFASALTSAVQADPDVIIAMCPFPLTAVKAQLDEAKQKGIAVVTIGGTGYPVGGKSSIVTNGGGSKVFPPLANLMSDIAIADAGKGPNAALVVDPSVPSWKPMISNFQKRIKAAGGKAGIISVPLSDLGKGAPGRIVSHLQANPDVKYLVLNIPAYYLGLKQALTSAGMWGKVKIVIDAADKTVLPSVQSGDVIGATAIELVAYGWRAVDAAARVVTKTKQPTQMPSSFLVINKKNAGMTGEALDAYPSRSADYVRAWKGPKKKK